MPTKENSEALRSLLSLRNKRVAHREHLKEFRNSETTFRKCVPLLQFANELLCVAGISFTGTSYGLTFIDDSETHIENEVGFSIRSLESIMSALGKLIESESLDDT